MQLYRNADGNHRGCTEVLTGIRKRCWAEVFDGCKEVCLCWGAEANQEAYDCC